MKKIVLALLVGIFASMVAVAEPVGYPGSTWSTLTGPAGVAGTEEKNVVLQGKLEQGIDWVRLGKNKNWTLNTYLSAGYSVDKDKLDYNNKIVPALGVKLSRKFDNGVVDFGIQAVHERRWIDGKSGSGIQAYATYWFGWDLKK
jgi:hypothetical protein